MNASDRNDLGYSTDSTPVEVVTQDGRRGTMPAWLAEVCADAGVVDVTPRACEVCGATGTLAGINGRWFCPDHLDVLGEQLRALREAMRPR